MCHPAHLSSFGASQRHAGMQPGLGTQPCRPPRTAPGTAQPILAPTPGCWCWCDWSNQNWPVMPGPFPRVHPREHSPVTLEVWGCQPETPAGLGGPAGEPHHLPRSLHLSVPQCLPSRCPSVPAPAPVGFRSGSEMGSGEHRAFVVLGSWD